MKNACRSLPMLSIAVWLFANAVSAHAQTLKLQPVVTSGISQPMFATAPRGDTNRLFVAERSGSIRIVNLTNNSVNATPYLSISVSTEGERGLLGLAFDPNFATNGYFYVNYTAPAGTDVGDQIIARYQANGDPMTATTANPTGVRILRLDRPSTTTSNHNGGWIGFSPNNADNLYIAVGDGGGGNDQFNTAQNVNSPHGKMLRIDVHNPTGGRNYGIPAGNPYATGGGLPEIWALGLRNPWRDSFDRATGDLWIGDVGQGAREEIDYTPNNAEGGLNYGWAFREGDIPGPKSAPNPIPGTSVVEPLVVHDRTQARSITGGYVYRGGIASLQGQYIYGDFITGRSWSLKYDGTTLMGPVERTSQLDPDGTGPLNMANQLASFAEDGFGEMYMLALGRSTIYRIEEVVNEWTRTSGGTWHTAANWSEGTIPNSNTAIARLWGGQLADGTVDLVGVDTTVKILSFRNGVSSYTVGATNGGRLRFESDSGNASIVYQNLNYRDHTITAGITLASDLDIKLGAGRLLTLQGPQDWGGRAVNVQSGIVRFAPRTAANITTNAAGASLTIQPGAAVELGGLTSATSDGTNHVDVVNHGALSIIAGQQSVGSVTGRGSVTVANPTVLLADHVRQASLAVAVNSEVNLRSGGGTSVLGALSLAGGAAPTATLDLNDNAIVFDYSETSPVDTIRQQILTARGGPGLNPTWTGKGITSSAAADAEVLSRSIGYAENSAMPLEMYTEFAGQPVDATSVLVAYTRTADANLDGVVDNDDVTIIGANYAPGAAKPFWALGDFDYNGFVDNDDVTLLGAYYNPSAAPLISPSPPSSSAVPVPEPGTMLLATAAAITTLWELLRRRAAR